MNTSNNVKSTFKTSGYSAGISKILQVGGCARSTKHLHPLKKQGKNLKWPSMSPSNRRNTTAASF